MATENLRIQFVSDTLVDQIIEGWKTASVAELGEVDVTGFRVRPLFSNQPFLFSLFRSHTEL